MNISKTGRKCEFIHFDAAQNDDETESIMDGDGLEVSELEFYLEEGTLDLIYLKIVQV